MALDGHLAKGSFDEFFSRTWEDDTAPDRAVRIAWDRGAREDRGRHGNANGVMADNDVIPFAEVLVGFAFVSQGKFWQCVVDFECSAVVGPGRVKPGVEERKLRRVGRVGTHGVGDALIVNFLVVVCLVLWGFAAAPRGFLPTSALVAALCRI